MVITIPCFVWKEPIKIMQTSLINLSSNISTKVSVRVKNCVTVAEEAVSAQLWIQANENTDLAALQVPSN